MRFLSLQAFRKEGKTGRSRGSRGRSLPAAGSLTRVLGNIFSGSGAETGHKEHSFGVLFPPSSCIHSLPFFLIKVKVSETIQYRVLRLKAVLKYLRVPFAPGDNQSFQLQ